MHKLMFGDMMGKLQEMQQKTEEAKARLSTITVKGEAGGVTVICSAAREVRDVIIPAELMESDPEELQDLIVLATNKALESAKNIEETELRGSMSDLLPNMPGLGNMFGK